MGNGRSIGLEGSAACERRFAGRYEMDPEGPDYIASWDVKARNGIVSSCDAEVAVRVQSDSGDYFTIGAGPTLNALQLDTTGVDPEQLPPEFELDGDGNFGQIGAALSLTYGRLSPVTRRGWEATATAAFKSMCDTDANGGMMTCRTDRGEIPTGNGVPHALGASNASQTPRAYASLSFAYGLDIIGQRHDQSYFEHVARTDAAFLQAYLGPNATQEQIDAGLSANDIDTTRALSTMNIVNPGAVAASLNTGVRLNIGVTYEAPSFGLAGVRGRAGDVMMTDDVFGGFSAASMRSRWGALEVFAQFEVRGNIFKLKDSAQRREAEIQRIQSASDQADQTSAEEVNNIDL